MRFKFLFLLSLFLAKIPNFYLFPFFKSSFLTSQALSRIIIILLFLYLSIFKKNFFEKIFKKNPLISIVIGLFFLACSLSIINALNLESFFSRFKDIIISFLGFFVFSHFQKEDKKIIKVFKTALIVNFLYQLLLIFSLENFLKEIIYQKHFDLVLAKLTNNQLYLDTYDEIIIPFLIKDFSFLNFIFLFLILFFAFLSNIRSRILMAIFALIFSLSFFKKKSLQKISLIFLLIFIVGYLTSLFVSSSIGYSFIDRFLIEDKSRDQMPLEARKQQINLSFEMAKGSLFGVGLGNYFDNLSSLEKNQFVFTNKEKQRLSFGAMEFVHNIFGSFLAETGFLGFLSFLILIILFLINDFFDFKNEKKRPWIIGFWTLFLYGFFNPPIPFSYQILFWGLRGILIK